MRIHRIALHHMRRFLAAELQPAAGLNLITGDNGAGKTTLLEALHLMAYGRSFRGRVRDGLIRQGAAALDVYVEWQESIEGSETGLRRRVGMSHTGQDWKGRLDGQDVNQMSSLCTALAVVTFEPGSHALISGGGEARRRFLDWGLFHVEPDFLPLWRRYARALKQRNALLKQGGYASAALDAWDRELSEAGETLTSRRLRYLERLQERVVLLAQRIAPGLEVVGLDFSPGWRRHELSLPDALLLARDRDRQYGYTSVGPHRADWRTDYAAIPGREALSRGQAKLTALACLMAQAEDFAAMRGQWPVVALDDLSSELDRHHQQRVVEHLLAAPAQVMITATEAPVALAELAVPYTVFHVEQGAVSRAVAG